MPSMPCKKYVEKELVGDEKENMPSVRHGLVQRRHNGSVDMPGLRGAAAADNKAPVVEKKSRDTVQGGNIVCLRKNMAQL